MGFGKYVRITRPPPKFQKCLDKKAEVINLVPIAQHPLQYEVKVGNRIVTLPADALEPCKIDRDEGGEEPLRYLLVNELMYCPNHEMEVCGSCGVDHRYTNFLREYTKDDSVDKVEAWIEEMQQIGAPPRKAPRSRGKKEAPGNPAVFQPEISNHLLMMNEDDFDPTELPIWPDGKSMEAALRSISSFSTERVPEAFKLPVRRVRETIVALARQYDSFLAEKDSNEPMSRMFLQDEAQTQVLNIDLILPIRLMEVDGVAFPILPIRWMIARATDGFNKKQNVLKTMERNTRMGEIPVETDEIDLMVAFLKANACRLKNRFIRSHGKKYMSVSVITPISEDMQRAHYKSISYCGQCGTSGCDFMKCSRCRKIKYCSKECQNKNWPYHKKNGCVESNENVSCSVGEGNMPTASGEIYPHELFEKALRRYCHTAAISDLNALNHGGKSYRRFVEAFGTNCRDSIPFLVQQESMQEIEKTYLARDKECPLVKALVASCGLPVLKSLSDFVYRSILTQLKTFGRPLDSKNDMLAAHEMRLAHDKVRQQQHKQQNVHVSRNTSASIRKNVSLHTTAIDWSSLSQLFVKDLKLYDSYESMYIEGELLIDPFTPMVGTTTILEDSHGDVILVALYNFLPEGLYGDESVPVASAKIPKGATVRIAAPFMKVFRDGSRGLRIDNPNEISVVSACQVKGGEGSEREVLLEAKNAGNQLVKKKKYLSAIEAYIGGLRAADVIPTILSNRSQAYAKLGEWEKSLADAAASLTIRPANMKTWNRYQTAKAMLFEGGQQNENESLWMINHLLPFELNAQVIEADTKGRDLLGLKNDGNTAFQHQKYAQAVESYTSALVLFGETERALLSNWALCCLHSQAHLDVVAVAAASLRIRPDAKTVVRLASAIHFLGQTDLCINILEKTDWALFHSNLLVKEKDDLLRDAKATMKLFRGRDNHFSLRELGNHKYLPRWIGNIETFDTGSRGRGVRATKDLKAGELLLLENPLASASIEGIEKAKDSLYTINKLRVEDASRSFLCQAIMLRSQRETILSQIVDCLFDGTNTRPLSSLNDLMLNFSLSLPLLPTHQEYQSDKVKVEFNSDRIGAIVSTNCHGTGNTFDFENGSYSALYPAVSMFNHSADPSCVLDVSSNCAKVIAKANVKAGEELTLCYHPDEKVVLRNWLNKLKKEEN